MTRRAITDEIWSQLLALMESKGCYDAKNGREVHHSQAEIRHLVGNLFARLKHYRSVATRFEKLARNFKSIVYIACSLIWIKVGK